MLFHMKYNSYRLQFFKQEKTRQHRQHRQQGNIGILKLL
jgi:hypothetical protein